MPRKASSIYGLNEGIASQGRLHRYNTTKTVSHNSLLHSPTIRSPLTRSPAAYDYSSDEQTVGSAIPPCDEVHGASGVRDSKSISSTEAVTSTHVNAASSDGYYDDDADIVDKLVPKIDSLAPQFAYLPPRSSKFTITN
ncbi:hypothetical protein GGI12_000103 [Dipsacomyces acuminosporus]|nr:hypothetical protein GGI12_000103 [Dipsacomyces acuminosporus]